MSWMTPREENFSIGGPFLVKRAAGAGDLAMTDGDVYTREQFHEAGVDDRVIKRMYAAHWLDMAPAEETVEVDTGGHAPPVHVKAENKPADEQGLSTGDQIPPTTENTPDGPEIGTGGDLEPKEAGEGGQPAPEGEAGAATAEGDAATAPADTTPTAYKCFGFGGYWAVNAAGEKLGPKMSKSEAEGFANRDALPLLGQTEPLPAQA